MLARVDCDIGSSGGSTQCVASTIPARRDVPLVL